MWIPTLKSVNSDLNIENQWAVLTFDFTVSGFTAQPLQTHSAPKYKIAAELINPQWS